MSCTKFESWIALYVEGDLPARKLRKLEAHLGECSPCRELAGALRESQAAVKDLRAEPVESAVLERIRGGVLERIAAQELQPARTYGWAWRLALAAALIAAIGLGTLWRGERREVPKQEVAVAPKPVEKAVAPAPRQRHVARAHKARPAAPAPATEVTEPLVVKLNTDDPNVVIIWLVDRNGG